MNLGGRLDQEPGTPMTLPVRRWPPRAVIALLICRAPEIEKPWTPFESPALLLDEQGDNGADDDGGRRRSAYASAGVVAHASRGCNYAKPRERH
jgi:hypothetical protein